MQYSDWFSDIFIDLSGSGNKVLDIGSGVCIKCESVIVVRH